MWQLTAQVSGYVEANTPKDKKGGGLSDREYEELSRHLDKTES